MYCKHTRSKRARQATLLALLGLASCAKPEFTHRVAVLRFESLSPGAESDWIGRALSEEVAAQLEGTRRNAVIPAWAIHQLDATLGSRPISAPGISTERAAAVALGANRIVTGFYTSRAGQLRITTLEENLEKRAETAPQIISGTTDEVLHLADAIARSIDEESSPPVTGSARALRAYALGMESDPAQSPSLFTDAVRLDPDFGPPYVALARLALAHRDYDEFGRVFTQVRARGNGVRAVDRALLNLEDARLHAPPTTQIDALAAVVRLLPADPFRLQELGTAEMRANRYLEAADHFRKLVTMQPSSPAPLNLLGYALMYSGDEPAATKAFESYRQSINGDTNSDANALDSLGDVQFFFGHFAEAEQHYRAAHVRDPSLNAGCELLKAAWCRLMRGDRVQAAALAATYRTERGNAGDPKSDARAQRFHAIAASTGAYDGPSGNPAVDALIKQNYAAAVPLWRKLAEDSPPDQWWTRTVYARVLLATGQLQEGARYLRFTPVPDPLREDDFDELWFPWVLRARLQARQ